MRVFYIVVSMAILVGCGPESKPRIRSGAVNHQESLSRSAVLRTIFPAEVAIDRAPSLIVQLHNESNKDLNLLLEREHRGDLGVEVANSSNKLLEITAYGAKNIRLQKISENVRRQMEQNPVAAIDYERFGSVEKKILLPGESHIWEIDLISCFKFTPGRYTVSVTAFTYPSGSCSASFNLTVTQ